MLGLDLYVRLLETDRERDRRVREEHRLIFELARGPSLKHRGRRSNIMSGGETLKHKLKY